MELIDRIDIDVGRKLPVEAAVEWAGAHGVRFIDCEIDLEPNALETFDEDRCAVVRAACARHGVRLGLHTLSAVNVAEVSPIVRDAVDRYLEAYVEAARRLHAGWVVVHAGYHFSSDREPRKRAALERLRRAGDHAQQHGVRLLLENLNREPERARGALPRP